MPCRAKGLSVVGVEGALRVQGVASASAIPHGPKVLHTAPALVTSPKLVAAHFESCWLRASLWHIHDMYIKLSLVSRLRLMVRLEGKLPI